MTLTIHVAEELYQRAVKIADSENIAVEELFTSALEERIVEFERLKERAARGSYEKFQRVMAKIPPADPAECDRF